MVCYKVERFFYTVGPNQAPYGPCTECEDGDYCNPTERVVLSCGPATVAPRNCRTWTDCYLDQNGVWRTGGVMGPWAAAVPAVNILTYPAPGVACPSGTPGPGGEE